MLHLFTKIKKNRYHYFHLWTKNLDYVLRKKNLQFLRYRVWRTEIGNFWSIFALLLPWKLKKSKFWKDSFFSFWVIFCPSTPENQNFEKLKKTTWDVIILHMSTINDNHMMYGSWNMECKTLNLLSVWIIFCPFTPRTIQKITILKKKEKDIEILSFYKCVPSMTIIWCVIPEIWSTTHRIFCHFGLFFALLYP